MRRLLVCLLMLSIVSHVAAQDLPAPFLEAFPEAIQARIELRDQQLSRATPPLLAGAGFEQIVRTIGKWRPGSTVTVAFFGGGPPLQSQIASIAREWTAAGRANLQLDFTDPATGQFRTWSPTDPNYKADIRISFDQPGYWSYIGTDSITSSVVLPGEPSMNLSGFNIQIPPDARAVILHEFGHALGFYHEHQHPTDPCDFRWDDDAGYVATVDAFGQFVPDGLGRRPGVYTVLAGPPNRWPRAKVNANLATLQSSHMLDVMAFDNASIMKYTFPAWMFVAGRNSHCFSTIENGQLSQADITAAQRAYPANPAEIQRVIAQQRRFLQELLKSDRLRQATRTNLENRLKGVS